MADAATLTFAFMRSHPAEAARLLETASSAETVELLTRVPARIGGAVLREMLPRIGARVVLALSAERAIELLTVVGSQPSTSILRHIDAPLRAPLIAGLPTTAALATKLLLEYVDDAVGSCMDPEAAAFPLTLRASEALDRVRNSHAKVDWVFGVDEQQCVLGWTPLAELLRAPQSATLQTLLVEPPGRLAAQAPLAGARSHPAWRMASTLPVVNRNGQLIGILTRDELDRAIQRRAQRLEHSRAAYESLAAVLVDGYWQSVSGVLQLLAVCLPAARPLGKRDDER